MSRGIQGAKLHLVVSPTGRQEALYCSYTTVHQRRFWSGTSCAAGARWTDFNHTVILAADWVSGEQLNHQSPFDRLDQETLESPPVKRMRSKWPAVAEKTILAAEREAAAYRAKQLRLEANREAREEVKGLFDIGDEGKEGYQSLEPVRRFSPLFPSKRLDSCGRAKSGTGGWGLWALVCDEREAGMHHMCFSTGVVVGSRRRGILYVGQGAGAPHLTA